MALKLVKEVNGYTAWYWRIGKRMIDSSINYAWCEIKLYKDEEYRHTAGAKPILVIERKFIGDNFPIDFAEVSKADNNETKALYRAVKKPVMVTNIVDGEKVETNTNELILAEDLDD